MAALYTVTMVRNEADRFLRSALGVWSLFSDAIIALDDHSDDATPELLSDNPKVIWAESDSPVFAWGAESGPRQKLWKLAWHASKPGDWLFWLDADMIPSRNPRDFLGHSSATAWNFRLYDLWHVDRWSRLLYRSDGFWRGHLHPRTWLIRRPDAEPSDGWQWSDRGIHCGHFPLNLRADVIGVATVDYSILHYAYSSTDLRVAKHDQYLATAKLLTDSERQHAASIMDPNPNLVPLPFTPDYRLLANTPVLQ